MSGTGAYVSLESSCDEALDWLRYLAETGPDLRVNAHKKAVHEALEFAVQGDLEEAADVLICLLGALDHQGYSVSDLAQAVYTKTEVNRGRTWARQPDGTWQHTLRDRPFRPSSEEKAHV